MLAMVWVFLGFLFYAVLAILLVSVTIAIVFATKKKTPFLKTFSSTFIAFLAPTIILALVFVVLLYMF